MWALEYDPDMFSTYEESGPATDRSAQGYKPRVKSTRQFGKYERANMKSATNGVDGPVPISVFLVASVLKENSQKLLQEARGLDDIIRVSFSRVSCFMMQDVRISELIIGGAKTG